MDNNNYKPFKDIGFVLVFINADALLSAYIWGIWEFGNVREMHIVAGSSLVLFVIWLWWIYYKKGQKGHFLVGFLIGMAAGFCVLMASFLFSASQENDFLMRMQQAQFEQMKKEMDYCSTHVKLSDYWSPTTDARDASSTQEEEIAREKYSKAWYACNQKGFASSSPQ